MKIKINGNYWAYYNDFSLSSNLDSVGSTFNMSVRFDPLDPEHKKLFRPGSYRKIQFYHDDGTVFSTGQIVSHTFSSSSSLKLACLSGYSLGGVIEDCQIPPSLYPLESNKLSLAQITTKLLDHFGLKLVVYDSAAKESNEVIEKSVAEPGETIKNYLSKIASQKNVVFSHDIYGNLIFFKPDPKALSKAFFTDENSLDIQQEINGQGLHSSITEVGQPGDDGSSGGGGDDRGEVTAVETIINPLVKANRPFVAVQSVGKETGTADGARDSLAVELKNIRVIVKLDKWYPDISIGDIVLVQSPQAYLYNKTRLMVANLTLSENAQQQGMELICVLPETFTGETPNDALWN